MKISWILFLASFVSFLAAYLPATAPSAAPPTFFAKLVLGTSYAGSDVNDLYLTIDVIGAKSSLPLPK